MTEIKDLLIDVEILINQLKLLIEKHQGDLVDPEIVTARKFLM